MNKANPREDCWRELEETKARLADTEARLAQRDVEATELKHRVANNLQLAASFLMLQARKLKPGTMRALAAARTSLPTQPSRTFTAIWPTIWVGRRLNLPRSWRDLPRKLALVATFAARLTRNR